MAHRLRYPEAPQPSYSAFCRRNCNDDLERLAGLAVCLVLIAAQNGTECMYSPGSHRLPGLRSQSLGKIGSFRHVAGMLAETASFVPSVPSTPNRTSLVVRLLKSLTRCGINRDATGYSNPNCSAHERRSEVASVRDAVRASVEEALRSGRRFLDVQCLGHCMPKAVMRSVQRRSGGVQKAGSLLSSFGSYSFE